MALALALGEVVAADPTMIGSIATGKAVITMLLKIPIRYLPSNSILNLLRLHLWVTTHLIVNAFLIFAITQRVEERIDQARKVQQVGSNFCEQPK
jgi:hypothetical protein